MADSSTPEDDPSESSGPLREIVSNYADGADRPLGTYLGAMGVYAGVVGTLGLVIRQRHAPLPRRVEPWDVAVMALATHKLARLIAKDPVTSPLRAPFTRFRGQSGPAELEEEVRGGPIRHGVGELVTCPFCLGQWVATGFAAGLVLAPRATRLVASTFAALAGADLLQFAYSGAEQAVQS
ncbi:MAG TPA: DUF1360 domain-containing protein [Acidimicrobiales bacterium]|nr:DUF1360 domain-containing protein [Acidimicrobiales bacterium]